MKFRPIFSCSGNFDNGRRESFTKLNFVKILSNSGIINIRLSALPHVTMSLLGVAINFLPRRNFPRDEGDNAREILVFATVAKIVVRWREQSAATECIKLAIKSGKDNRNKAATMNQPLGPFHSTCNAGDTRWDGLAVRGARDGGS